MDILTPVGLIGGALVLAWGAHSSQALSSFWNFHGVGIVIGGTVCATMVHCSPSELATVARAFLALMRSPKAPGPERMVEFLVDVCREARKTGLRSIQDVGARAEDDGFMSRALDVALGSGDSRSAQAALERDLNGVRARHREVGNILRMMGTLTPMFGLLGTLIGIVSVLRNLTDPDAVGAAMAVALSSAFYGIALSNTVFIPAAGKLRARSLAELEAKELVVAGILDIVYTQKAPTVVELGLRSYLHAGRAKE